MQYSLKNASNDDTKNYQYAVQNKATHQAVNQPFPSTS